MRDISEWIDEIRLLMPPCEIIVRISNVRIEDGLHVANAVMTESIGFLSQVQIVWLMCCNDQPNDGQDWLIEVLGYDIPSNCWLARALMRESD